MDVFFEHLFLEYEKSTATGLMHHFRCNFAESDEKAGVSCKEILENVKNPFHCISPGAIIRGL
jgi:hypothetical protein